MKSNLRNAILGGLTFLVVIGSSAALGLEKAKASRVGVAPRSVSCARIVSQRVNSSRIPWYMRGAATSVITSQVRGSRNYGQLVNYYANYLTDSRFPERLRNNSGWRRQLGRAAASATISARQSC